VQDHTKYYMKVIKTYEAYIYDVDDKVLPELKQILEMIFVEISNVYQNT